MQVHFKIHGQGKKNLNGDGLAIWYTKERMQKGKILKNNTTKAQYLFCVIFSYHCLLQVPYLEIWTTSPAWACLWTRIPTRRNTWRYAAQTRPHILPVAKKRKQQKKKIGEGRSKPCEKHFCNLLKKVCLVLFLCHRFATGAEETIHSSHAGNPPLESQTETSLTCLLFVHEFICFICICMVYVSSESVFFFKKVTF